MNTSYNQLRSYAYYLVAENKVSYAQLDEEEKQTITGIIIKSLKLSEALEYLTEADKDNQLPWLLADFLESKSLSVETSNIRSNNLLDYISSIACKYASNTIDHILEDVNDQYQTDKRYYGE